MRSRKMPKLLRNKQIRNNKKLVFLYNKVYDEIRQENQDQVNKLKQQLSNVSFSTRAPMDQKENQVRKRPQSAKGSIPILPLTIKAYPRCETRPQSAFIAIKQFGNKGMSSYSQQQSMISLKALMRYPNNNSFRKLNMPITSNFTESLKYTSSINKCREVNSLDVEKLLDLYVARCEDNKINYLPEQAAKFIEKIRKTSIGGLLNLQEQQLGWGSAHVLSQIIQKNTRFTHLNLARNSLSRRGVYTICRALVQNQSIIHLNLSSNDIPSKGAQKLFQSLKRNNSIISLDVSSKEGLNRNHMGKLGAKSLGELLKVNISLQFLNISGNALGTNGFEEIIEGLTFNKDLSSLNASMNEINHVPLKKLSEILPLTNLLDLNLSKNKFGNQGIIELCVALRDRGEKSAILERLNVSNCGIQTSGCQKFFDTIRQNGYLKRLNMARNHFNNGGFKQPVINFLWENETLTHINLQECQLEYWGGTAFGLGLKQNKTLKVINLSKNHLTCDGVYQFGEQLATNTTLTHVDFSSCRIKDRGGIQLSLGVRVNKTLKYLNLRDNSLDSEAGYALQQALIHNETIVSMDLARNPMQYKYIVEINKGIKKNKFLYKKTRQPNLKIEKKNLIDFIAIKESVLEEIDEAKYQKLIAQEELQIEVDILAKNTEEENAKFAIIKEKHSINCQVELDKEDEYKQSVENVRSNLQQSVKDVEDIKSNTEMVDHRLNLLINQTDNIKRKKSTTKYDLQKKIEKLKEDFSKVDQQEKVKKRTLLVLTKKVDEIKAKIHELLHPEEKQLKKQKTMKLEKVEKQEKVKKKKKGKRGKKRGKRRGKSRRRK